MGENREIGERFARLGLVDNGGEDKVRVAGEGAPMKMRRGFEGAESGNRVIGRGDIGGGGRSRSGASRGREKMGKERRIRNINLDLPPHMIQLIFSKLPFFSLPTCRIVCKAWNNLILTSKFVPSIQNAAFFAHIYPYDSLYCIDFDYKHSKGMNIVASFSFHPSIQLVSCCNGLLLFQGMLKTGPCVGILNPMTNGHMILPSSDADAEMDRNMDYCYELGFSPNTKQYKIVRHSYEKESTLVEIFAFGTSNAEWTQVHSTSSHVIDGHGVYFNGALYWIGYHNLRDVVFRFDVEDEKLEEISFPQVRQEYDNCYIQVFNGTIYLSSFNFKRLEYLLWKMEQDSWIVAFVVALPEHMQVHLDPPSGPYDIPLIKAYEDGKILCLVSGTYLIMYDSKTRRVESLNQVAGNREYLSVFQIESFNFDPLDQILGREGGLEDYVNELTWPWSSWNGYH